MKSEPHLIVNSNLVTVFLFLVFSFMTNKNISPAADSNLTLMSVFRRQFMMINCDSFAVVCSCLSQTTLKYVPLSLFIPSESRPRHFSTCLY